MTSKEKTKSLVNKATTNDRNPPSGYLLNELASRTLLISECQKIEDLVVKKLAKNKAYTKYKALRIIKFLSENGSSNWRRGWQINKDKLRDAQQFRGSPDPIYGDAPYQQVRKAAKDAMKAIFQQSTIDSSYIKNKIKGYSSSSRKFGGSLWDKNPNTSYQPTVRTTTFEPVKSRGGSSDNNLYEKSKQNNLKRTKASSGEYERRWVDDIVKSGGVGCKILYLPKYVQQFENLSKNHVLEYLDEKLEDSAWQKQGKTLVLIEGLIKGKSSDDVIDYFSETPQNVQVLLNSKKSILRRKANVVVQYLDVSEEEEEEEEVVEVQQQQAPYQGVDLLNMEEEDDDMFANMNIEQVQSRNDTDNIMNIMDNATIPTQQIDDEENKRKKKDYQFLDIVVDETNVTQNDGTGDSGDILGMGFGGGNNNQTQQTQNNALSETSAFGFDLSGSGGNTIKPQQQQNNMNNNVESNNMMNPMMIQQMLQQNEQNRQFIQNNMSQMQNMMNQMQQININPNMMNQNQMNMNQTQNQNNNNKDNNKHIILTMIHLLK